MGGAQVPSLVGEGRPHMLCQNQIFYLVHLQVVSLAFHFVSVSKRVRREELEGMGEDRELGTVTHS